MDGAAGGSNWAQAFALLAQIEAPPPPPEPGSGKADHDHHGRDLLGQLGVGLATPCVTVRTAQPVTLSGRVRNVTGKGVLIDAIPGGAVRLTVENLRAYGGFPWQNSGRFLWTTNHHTLTVRNCTIENTTGIEVNGGVAGGQVLITRNRQLNVQGYIPAGQIVKIGNFVQFRTCTSPSIEVSWNEVWNEYNKSFPEDIISIYHTSNVKVLDNMLWGQCAIGNHPNASIGGITLDASDAGPPVNNCHVARNSMIEGGAISLWPNVGGGSNNLLEDNRIVAGLYLPNGQKKANGWAGLIVQPGGSTTALEGTWSGTGRRTGTASTSTCRGRLSRPTHRCPILWISAEKTRWQAKVAAAGVTIGARDPRRASHSVACQVADGEPHRRHEELVPQGQSCGVRKGNRIPPGWSSAHRSHVRYGDGTDARGGRSAGACGCA